MIACPYCKKKIEDIESIKIGHDSGYDMGNYWDQCYAYCPHCANEFMFFEHFKFVGYSVHKVKE